jgi:hypothetical protein
MTQTTTGCQRNGCKGCTCRKNLSDHDAIRLHMNLPATPDQRPVIITEEMVNEASRAFRTAEPIDRRIIEEPVTAGGQ